MIMPDIPKLVSFDYLKLKNAEPAERWMGQPKYDGWRRIITPPILWQGWRYNAKNHSEQRQMPFKLRDEFENTFGRMWLKTVGFYQPDDSNKRRFTR